MSIEMLVNDTGLYQARINSFATDFLEKEKGRIAQLVRGEQLKVHRVYEISSFERYEVDFHFVKGGLMRENKLEVFVDGRFVAVCRF